MSRLKKMYIRNSSGVFVAVVGFEYSNTIVFVDSSVYTLARTLGNEEWIELEKKRLKRSVVDS